MKNTKTYRQQFEEAMACSSKEMAAKWLDLEVARYMRLDYFIGDEHSARKIILENIGYMAGYYNQDASQKIYDLFGAEHPIFGKPDYWERVTPEEAFNIGREMGERAKRTDGK